MRILKFHYLLYNFILNIKFLEVLIKEFIKFNILSCDYQKKRFFWERVGISGDFPVNGAQRKWVWIHANAIGEVNASCQLVRLIRERYPHVKILLTTSNLSADRKAAQLSIADTILFFPHDIPFIVKRFLKKINSCCVVIIESDIWPNFIRICKKENIPVLVVSGIFTDSSARSLGIRYFYNLKFKLSGKVLEGIGQFCMQTESDAQRLTAYFPERKSVTVTGNLKFGCLNGGSAKEGIKYYQKIFNIKDGDPVFIAGNVHKEECEAILEVFQRVKNKVSGFRMVLAPRFMSDIRFLGALLKNKSLKYVLRSTLDTQRGPSEDIIILDTTGELMGVYGVGRIAFVGGSFVYLGDMFGGHNILEPAAMGLPVIFGPYMHNFQSLSDLFCRQEAAVKVSNKQELADCIIHLLNNNSKSEKMVTNARVIFEDNKDVAEKTFSAIDAKLRQAIYD